MPAHLPLQYQVGPHDASFVQETDISLSGGHRAVDTQKLAVLALFANFQQLAPQLLYFVCVELACPPLDLTSTVNAVYVSTYLGLGVGQRNLSQDGDELLVGL